MFWKILDFIEEFEQELYRYSLNIYLNNILERGKLPRLHSQQINNWQCDLLDILNHYQKEYFELLLSCDKYVKYNP